MRKILLLLVTVLGTLVASAQEVAKSNQSESNYEELSARLSKQEKRLATLEKVRQYAKLSGFMQAQYDWTEDTEGNEKTGTST